MKKFLRFDPGSFNVFYLGTLIVAGVAVVSLSDRVLTDPGSQELSDEIVSSQRENPVMV